MIIQGESQQVSNANAVNDKLDPLVMQAGRGQAQAKNSFCNHCKMKGHTKKNYYKIIGYPSDFKQKKRYGIGSYDGWNPPSGGPHEGWRKEPLAAANSADIASSSQIAGNHKASEHK